MGILRTAISLLILQKQVEFIICSKSTLVVAREGGSVEFTCHYPVVSNNTRFFCWASPACKSHLIFMTPPALWMTYGRFALHDNITAGQFVVQMDKLKPGDSGTYWCGVKDTHGPDTITVFQLSVTDSSTTRKSLTQNSPGLTLRPKILVKNHNLSLFVAVVSCLSALVVVFLFTLCLVFTVRNRRQTQRRTRTQEMSEDYEVMTSGVLPKPCSSPDFRILSNNPQNPPPEVSHCTEQRRPKQSESLVLETLSEEVLDCANQYHELDLSSVEEHIYHGIRSKLTVRDRQDGQCTQRFDQ